MPTPSEQVKGRRQFNVSLPDDHALMLTRIAESAAAGSKSAAVEMLLDLYGGKVLERVQQEKDFDSTAAAPVAVTKWQAPKLSMELVAYMAGLVRAGNLPVMACQLAGITPRQRNAWLKKGRADRQNGVESLHADLVAALERAEAECEAEDIQRLRAHGKTSWTALAWRLERQYPDRYAQRKRLDGRIEHTAVPLVDWDRLTPVEVRTLVELLRKASPEGDEPGVSRLARPAMELVPADVVEAIETEFHELPELEAGKPDA